MRSHGAAPRIKSRRNHIAKPTRNAEHLSIMSEVTARSPKTAKRVARVFLEMTSDITMRQRVPKQHETTKLRKNAGSCRGPGPRTVPEVLIAGTSFS